MGIFSERKQWTRILSMVLVGLVLLCTKSAMADDIVPGHVLVRIQPRVNAAALAAAYGSVPQDRIPGTDIYSFTTPNGTTEEAFAAQLSLDIAHVVFAEPDRYVVSPEVEGTPFHTAFDRSMRPQTYANSVSYVQISFNGIDPANRGNSRPLSTGARTVIAVLDTGATFDHPGLRNRFLPGYNVLAPSQPPKDLPDGITNAEYGHGTMIAGIIVRLAPATRILPVRVINGDGVGTILGLAKGIYYANAQRVNVINLSLSCSVNSGVLNDALDQSENAGIVLVAAAGNLNTDRVNPPAKGHGTISVGSVEADNRKSLYSNYGSFVRVVAPGSDIRSTYPGGGYATWSGTSFAAPFVAAQAALILSLRPTLSSDQVKDIIRATAHSVDNVNPAYDGELGEGMIDIEAALRAARR